MPFPRKRKKKTVKQNRNSDVKEKATPWRFISGKWNPTKKKKTITKINFTN